MKKLLLILFLITGTACSTIVYVPQNTQLQEIKAHAVDNQTASLEVQKLFIANGQQCRLISGCVFRYGETIPHCWNEVWCPEDQKWHLIDLSTGFHSIGWPVEQYPEYKAARTWETPPRITDLSNARHHISGETKKERDHFKIALSVSASQKQDFAPVPCDRFYRKCSGIHF